MTIFKFNDICYFAMWANKVKATAEEQKRVLERVPPCHRDHSGEYYSATTLDHELECVRAEISQGLNHIPVSPQETNRAIATLVESFNQDRIERKQQHEEQKGHLEVLTATATNSRRRPDPNHMTTTELAKRMKCTTANVLRIVSSGDSLAKCLVEGTNRPKAQRKFKRKETEAWLRGWLKSKGDRH